MRFAPLIFLFVLPIAVPTHAGWKDDVGYTRLQQTFSTGVPTAISDGVTQVEAADKNGFHLPNTASSDFAGKTITNKSSTTGVSTHATVVGSLFYGTTNSLVPGTTLIDAYNATHWQGAGFLNLGTSFAPLTEPRGVQNHSWIGSYNRSTNTLEAIGNTVANINLRLDYAVAADGFVSVVGVGNTTSTTLPDLLCQGYHSISIGRVDGQHSAGLTVFDIPGRMKPDLVSFATVTSHSTPQVASAAALLYQKLGSLNLVPSLTTEDYPRVTKALLLAGASKEPLSSWSRASVSKPYDARSGAGALNILLAYRILNGGRTAASDSALTPNTAWSTASLHANTSAAQRTHFFEVPAGSTVPFSAALTWHRAFGETATLANLDLRLYAVSPGTFTLGDEIDASLSTVDNVEHVYQSALPPGRYALQVTSSDAAETSYALAWRTSPAVTVAATSSTARELDGSPAVFTVSRTSPTTAPLLVPIIWGGTAVSGTHYETPPDSVLIPAGETAAAVQVTPTSDTLAQGDRTITLSVVTDFSLTAGAASSASVTIQDKPYDTWRFARFTSEELADPLVSGDAADPDADNLPNLFEYASSSEPKTPNPIITVPVVGTSDNRITLTYTRPTTPPADITYAVEWSSDLLRWTSGANVTETVSTIENGNDTTTVLVRSVESLTSTPRQFLRLRITRR